MDMIPVESSNVAAVGYEPASMTLCIAFKNGRRYNYAGVPEDEWRQLLAAKSKGQFVSRHIKTSYEASPT